MDILHEYIKMFYKIISFKIYLNEFLISKIVFFNIHNSLLIYIKIKFKSLSSNFDT